MTASETIFQCGVCLRFLRGGEVLPLAGADIADLNAKDRMDGVQFTEKARLQFADCGRADCAEVEARRERAEQVRREFKRSQRLARPAGERPPLRAVRSSCPPEKDFEDVQTPSPGRPPTDLENDFRASGAADSANALFIAWFKRIENFNIPFSKKFLEETVMQGKSGCVNNRAKDCRDEFINGGLYIDNDPTGAVWAKKFGWRLPKGSYYRLCRIEDATSLPELEKYKLTHPEPEML